MEDVPLGTLSLFAKSLSVLYVSYSFSFVLDLNAYRASTLHAYYKSAKNLFGDDEWNTYGGHLPNEQLL